jgi:integrase
MGITYNEKTKSFIVTYSKRHPVTRQPVGRRRVAKTKAEARRIEKDLVLLVNEKIREKIIPSWESLVDQWTQDAKNRDLTPKTIENYLYSLRAYTFQPWGKRLVDTITTQEIRELILNDLSEKSDHHKQSVLKFIRCTFEFGIEAGHIQRNPAPKMKFRLGDKIKKVLTREQVEKLLTQAKLMNCEWYPHWAFAIYTGMRNGEIYALTWDKVDLDSKKILVNCSWSKQNGVKSTKSGDDRIVPIAPPLLTILKELKLSNPYSDHVLPRIAKWDKGDQARELRFFLQGLGIEQCRFHDLRATFATLLLQQGTAPIQVMKAGGWKSLKTMMIYVRKAGIDLQGMMDDFKLHDPCLTEAKVLKLNPTAQDSI